MKTFLMMSASATAATVACFLFFVPMVWPSADELVQIVTEQWPAISLLWVSCYAFSLLVLNTILAVIESVGIPVQLSGGGFARLYLLRLFAGQYFSCALILLLIGFIPEASQRGYELYNALVAFGAISFSGLVSWFIVSIVILARIELSVRDGGNKQSLRGHPELVPSMDIGDLFKRLENSQRPIIESLLDLARVVGRLGVKSNETLEAIKIMQVRQEEATGHSSELKQAAAEVFAAIARIETSLDKLSQAGDSIPIRSAPAFHAGPSQMVTELEQLLNELSGRPTGSRRTRDADRLAQESESGSGSIAGQGL